MRKISGEKLQQGHLFILLVEIQKPVSLEPVFVLLGMGRGGDIFCQKQHLVFVQFYSSLSLVCV
jgi:hypothetical protein